MGVWLASFHGIGQSSLHRDALSPYVPAYFPLAYSSSERNKGAMLNTVF